MKKYVFRPYNPIFKELFQTEKNRILKALGSHAICEHIGSTAIEELGGKGIIDVLVLVKENQMDIAKELLINIGYKFNTKFSTNERYFFFCDLDDDLEGTRRYHIHLTNPDSQIAKDLVLFRDYLNKHPDLKHEYARIKQEALKLDDGEGKVYKVYKEPFIESIKRLMRL